MPFKALANWLRKMFAPGSVPSLPEPTSEKPNKNRVVRRWRRGNKRFTLVIEDL